MKIKRTRLDFDALVLEPLISSYIADFMIQTGLFGQFQAVVVVVVVVFILDLAGLTTCFAMRGVPAHAMLQVKVIIQILKPISPRNESQIPQ